MHGPGAFATLPHRIGDSASGLLRESMGLLSPRAVTGALASLNADNSKAGASSSFTDTGPSSLEFPSSSRCASTAFDHSKSFHSIEEAGNTGKNDGQIAFDRFVTERTNFEHEPDLSQDRTALSSDHSGGSFAEVAEDGLPQVKKRKTWATRDEDQKFTDQNNDGAAVVALLSDPSFAVDEEPSGILDLESDVAEGLSFQRLHTTPEPAPSVCDAHPLKPFDLMPDFGCPENFGHAFSAMQKAIHEREHFLESGSEQLQPWIDILDRYHDEVWGEMLPLVQDAREELEAATERQASLKDGSAIRRLQMVLQHVGSLKIQ